MAQAAPDQALQSGAEDALSTLKAIAETGILFLGLSFAGGWSFMAAYYQAFGISPYELDFSVPATSVFSIHILLTSFWPLLIAMVLYIGLSLFYVKLGLARRTWAGIFVVMLTFMVAKAGGRRGRTLAAEDVLETSPRLPNVGFLTKTTMAQGPDCLVIGTTDCKLLLHTKAAYYFFQPIRVGASDSAHHRNISVYIVPDSEISSTQLIRGIE